VIAYPAMLDVPRELVQEVARLLRDERRARGTRTGARMLTCWNQALMVLAWFRNHGDIALVGAGFRVSRATSYRYRDEVVDVLADQAPDLHDALSQVAAQGWSHVVMDGKVFRTDRTAETTTSVKGATINTWYSGKHRAFGGNVQAIMRPDGLPVWVSDVVAGHQHDVTVARTLGLLGALYWAASQLGLPALADGGYDGAGIGVHTPVKQPGGGQVLAPDNQAYNALHRATRCRGERGFALLTGRWKALRRITASPSRIGDYVKAGLVLLHIEHIQLGTSC
jgi:hypothetical protein